ncbi:hypothetical protein Tco_0565540 [Tanacetum coccineum]
MLVIKQFSERKKVFKERKKTGKIRAKRRNPKWGVGCGGGGGVLGGGYRGGGGACRLWRWWPTLVGVSLEVRGEDYGFDSNEEEVVPKVDDVSLVDGVFDSAFSGEGEEDVVMEEGWRRKLEWNSWYEGLKKMKMIRRVGRMAYLIRKHRIEEVKHED